MSKYPIFKMRAKSTLFVQIPFVGLQKKKKIDIFLFCFLKNRTPQYKCQKYLEDRLSSRYFWHFPKKNRDIVRTSYTEGSYFSKRNR
jgi:hypothetical protein